MQSATHAGTNSPLDTHALAMYPRSDVCRVEAAWMCSESGFDVQQIGVRCAASRGPM